MKPLSRRTFLLGGGVALASYLAYEVKSLRVVRYTVPVQNLPLPFHGFTILHLSDLHQKLFGREQARLREFINQQRFDMVAVTGDLINQFQPDLEPALTLLHGLTTKPIFFVNGNNESGAMVRHHYQISDRLKRVGVATLNNRALPLVRGEFHLWIAGIDDPSNGRDRLDLALSGTGDGAPVILLSHCSCPFPRAAKDGLPLVLTGHTHGGQIRIPFVGALWAPGMGLLPRWDYGAFREGKTTLIVNGGLGESILPLRFGIPPEIVLVTLTSSKGAAGA